VVVLVVLAFLAARALGDEGDGTATDGAPGDDRRSTTTATTDPPRRPDRQPDRPATSAPGAGDDAPADELLATLTVTEEGSDAGYERDEFGEGWRTDRRDCDVRERVLAEESQVPVTREDDECTVVEGEWVSLYDGYATPDPDELEIDHVVALAEAWESGADDWSDERRERFANDTRRPDALIAVTAATNQSKSDRDPAEWMPPNRDAWCRYAEAWITQKSAWELTVDRAERRALRNVLATC
jgi:Protein of unknown function (DUF1524)